MLIYRATLDPDPPLPVWRQPRISSANEPSATMNGANRNKCPQLSAKFLTFWCHGNKKSKLSANGWREWVARMGGANGWRGRRGERRSADGYVD
jgi:hypothetical protein